ncbi:O-antigen ligase family protein [Methylocaldum gracile]|jgi:O-antigen ligase|uniref:O-antigen ligase family protein n=1 Tax=unclassified Methylocaldum TaxID=2622260 RepID=UPI00105BE521
MVAGVIAPPVQYANYTGVTAALAFAFFAWLSPAGTNIALAAFSLAFLLNPSAWPVFRRDPMFGLFAAFAIYVAIGAYFAIDEFPETRKLQIRDASNWLKLFAFLPLAWWLRGDLRRIHWTLILATGGLLIGMLWKADWSNLYHMTVAERTGFKLRIIFSGLVSASAILGLLIYTPRIWSTRTSPLNDLFRLACWLAALYLSSFMLISSKSRGAWLAALIAVPSALGIHYFWKTKRTDLQLGKSVPFMLLALGVVVGLFALNHGEIRTRIDQENAVVSSILQGENQHLPRTSIGYRHDIQKFGLQKYLDRPWFGWGPGSTEHLVEISGQPELIHPQAKGAAWMDHFHNTYLEILVRFGLLGALVLAATVLLVIKNVWHSYKTGILPKDHFAFLAGCFILLAVWSLFDFRILHGDCRAYWILLAGIAYSFAWHPDAARHD